MSFLYVDRIAAYEPGRRILGLKNVTRTEPLLFPGPDGRRVAHPALVIEAFAQTAAWLAILDEKFERRPLFLGEDLAELPQPVMSGDQIVLDVELIRYSDDVVETRGTATVQGKVVFRSTCGRGFLMPTKDFEDPKHVEKRYAELNRPGPKKGPEPVGRPDASHAIYWEASRRRPIELVDTVIRHTPLVETETLKNVTVSEEFFQSHFPRRPVVPGVIVVSMMMDAAEMLTRSAPEALGSRRNLALKRVDNVRFRKPIEPGDQCVVKAKTKRFDPKTRELVVTAAVYTAQGRAAHIEMTFLAASRLPAEGGPRGAHEAAG